MKVWSLRRFALAGSLCALLAPATVLAQQPAAAAASPGVPVILVVDVQMIRRDSKAAKGIAQQAEQQRQAYTKEISKTEADLRAAHDELERQRSILSPEAYGQKMRDFQQRVDELGRSSQTKRQTLEYSFNLAMRHVDENMIAVVSDIAIERK